MERGFLSLVFFLVFFFLACGHDGHTASLLGAAMILNDLKDELHGNIKLMFQPDEEITGGAKPMIEEGILDNPKVDAAFAGHLWGDIEEGKVGYKPGTLMASPDLFNIKVRLFHGQVCYCLIVLLTSKQIQALVLISNVVPAFGN